MLPVATAIYPAAEETDRSSVERFRFMRKGALRFQSGYEAAIQRS